MFMVLKVSHAIDTCIAMKFLLANSYSYKTFNCILLISERNFLKIIYGKLNNEVNIHYDCYSHSADGENRFREIKNFIQDQTWS